MGRIIALTAKSLNGQDYRVRPRVVYVQEDNIQITPPSKNSKVTRVTEKIENETNVYQVYEKGMQIEAMRNPSSTDLLVKQQIALGLAGVGITQASARPLPAYFNETLENSPNVDEAFKMASAILNKVVVVVNNDPNNNAAKIFPQVGESFSGQLTNAAFSLAGRDRIHFVCLVAGKWTLADDFGK